MSNHSTFSVRSLRTRAAFTLVEILVVVIVLGILAALVAPNFAKAKDKSSDAIRVTQMKAVADALEQYYGVYDAYPSTGGGWWGDAPGYGGKEYTGASAYIPNLSPRFLKMLPQDPTVTPSGQRGYLYRSDGRNYKLLAHYTPKTYGSDLLLFDHKRPNHAWMIATPGGKDW